MNLMNLILYLTISPILILCVEKTRYLSIEHPVVSYYNPKYIRYANATAQRYRRSNPVYYVGFHIDALIPLDNNVFVEFYFYEFLTNVYKRSFVEFYYKWCDLITKDQFFGVALRQGKFLQPCPYPPGVYNWINMTVPPASIPKSFPFTKGRICVNFTYTKTKELLGFGHMDMEIKEVKKIKENNITFTNHKNF